MSAAVTSWLVFWLIAGALVIGVAWDYLRHRLERELEGLRRHEEAQARHRHPTNHNQGEQP
jgi:hypothetical protein